VAELFPELADDAADPPVLFNGGPVERDGIICLARGVASEEALLDDWGSIDPREPPPDGIEAVRVYRGYAGWSGRQLEDELARDSWLVVDALPHDLTTDEPASLWEHILDRQGPRYQRLKRVPANPSLN
jgi:putative transcriptional regulator